MEYNTIRVICITIVVCMYLIMMMVVIGLNSFSEKVSLETCKPFLEELKL